MLKCVFLWLFFLHIAEHDYEVNLKAEILIEEVLKRLNKIEENQNVIMKHFNTQVHNNNDKS
jgi:uncharacterized membrane protein